MVPETNRNPIRSLRPTSVVFTWQGREYEIPALPAVDWLEVLMDPNWMAEDIMLALLPNGDRLVNELSLDELDNLGLDILEEVSARHWWIADRLIQTLGAAWDTMGAEAVLNHVDPEKLSLAAWLDAMLMLLMRRISSEQAPMFTSRLELPPPGEELDQEELEMSPEQFLAIGDD